MVNGWKIKYRLMILLGFRYLASSIPLIVFAGVGVGVGLIFSMLLNSMARNPLISNNLVRTTINYNDLVI